MKVGQQVWHSGESTRLVLLLFGGQHPENGPTITLKGVFQQNFQECNDFVTNSCGPWDSSCQKSRVPASTKESQLKKQRILSWDFM